MTKIKQLAGQTAIYGLGTIVPRLLNYFLLTPVFTWIFKESEFGVVTELYAYTAFLLVLLLYGMETSFFYFSEKKENKDKVYSTSVLCIVLTSVLFVFTVIYFAEEIAGVIRYKNNVEYIIWFAIIIGLDTIVAIPFAKLRKENKALKFAIIKIVGVLVNITLIFILLVLPELKKTDFDINNFIYLGIEDKISYVFISNLIASCVTFILLTSEILKIKIRIDFSLLKEMLIYAFPILVVGLAGMINEVADKIMIKYLVVDKKIAIEMVGVYGANYKLAMIMTIFVQMFRYAAEPFFFEQAKLKNAKEIYSQVMKYFVIIGLSVFLFVVLFLDVVKYFIGPNFHSGLHIVPIVLLANLFLGIYYNLSVWYKVNNITKYGAFIALIGAGITILLNFILIPVIGYLGSAWATFICYFVMMFISYLWGRKFYKIDYDLRLIGFYFVLAVILYAIKQVLTSENIIISLLISTILISSYIVIIEMKDKLITKIIKR